MVDKRACLPLVRIQGDLTRGSGILPCLICEPQQASRDDALGRQVSLNPVCVFQLQFIQPTPAFQDDVIPLYHPPMTVPEDALACLG
ncbi:MAG: hypothetical protein KatS3mg054_1284 [Chloroflexus sp.]|nr:MAG: hypothetical protein KatS3mg054_1284 [Chloroflexus sp.]GIV93078.1 MAG: hypothetical protein KatS3mg056_1787 [Chloroflexus sp.]